MSSTIPTWREPVHTYAEFHTEKRQAHPAGTAPLTFVSFGNGAVAVVPPIRWNTVVCTCGERFEGPAIALFPGHCANRNSRVRVRDEAA